MKILRRLRTLFRRRNPDAEMADEMRTHGGLLSESATAGQRGEHAALCDARDLIAAIKRRRSSTMLHVPLQPPGAIPKVKCAPAPPGIVPHPSSESCADLPAKGSHRATHAHAAPTMWREAWQMHHRSGTRPQILAVPMRSHVPLRGPPSLPCTSRSPVQRTFPTDSERESSPEGLMHGSVLPVPRTLPEVSRLFPTVETDARLPAAARCNTGPVSATQSVISCRAWPHLLPRRCLRAEIAPGAPPAGPGRIQRVRRAQARFPSETSLREPSAQCRPPADRAIRRSAIS